jgi:hypothetical protein
MECVLSIASNTDTTGESKLWLIAGFMLDLYEPLLSRARIPGCCAFIRQDIQNPGKHARSMHI